MFKFKEYRFRYYNLRLILFSMALAVAGILFVRSATINTGAIPSTSRYSAWPWALPV